MSASTQSVGGDQAKDLMFAAGQLELRYPCSRSEQRCSPSIDGKLFHDSDIVALSQKPSLSHLSRIRQARDWNLSPAKFSLPILSLMESAS